MHTIVIGSGVIGTTTAYYLARSGHRVTVVDRQSGAGLETSFANAGQVSPGYSAPWAAPGIPLKAIKWLLSAHSPLVISPRIDGAMLRFMVNMLRNCTAPRYAVNKSRMLRLAEYSRFAFGELRADTGIDYDERTRGTLQLFRSMKQVQDAEKDIAVLQECGVPYERLDVEACVAAEPALARVAHKLAGGLRLPLDETGDCYKFTDGLAQQCVELGVDFRFGVTAQDLITRDGRVIGLYTDKGLMQADNYVVALGSYSPRLLKPLGIDLPIYPVKGYSLTLPVTCDEAAPVSTVMDETHKVAVTRLGDRIRVAGTAELTGYSLALKPQRRGTVTHVVRDLFPDGGDIEQAEFWTGLRPMTPDGTPVVGPTPYSNLYLNTGHGTLGWTMSCGSGRLLADVMNERQPEIDIDGLTMQRYRGAFKPKYMAGGATPIVA
ncbi:MAG: D-amino acid dehydrogenase [Gammaproteobacteria bacterium]|nr:D-amino acid dehydrogenase [Gammaproteobacteria bacterium]